MKPEESSIIVCINRRLGEQRSCAGSGSEELARIIQERLDADGLPVSISRIKCFGRCDRGPVVRIAPGGQFFENFTETDIDMLISQVHEFIA